MGQSFLLTGLIGAAAVSFQVATAKHHLHDNKCRVLSFRGGGVHGAFEAGVVKALTDHMPKTELFYDYVAGVSIGAINASIFATFATGEESQAAEYISSMYEGQSTENLFDWYSPLFIKAFTETSLSDNTEFKNRLKKAISGKPWKRKLSIIAGDIITGQPLFFDETVPEEMRVEAVISSTSIPFIFPPREVEDMYLVDGGLFANISLGDPIERCREDGYADKDIIVDAILCYGDIQTIDEWATGENMRWKNAGNFYSRRKDITSTTMNTEDYQRLIRGYHNIDFRFAFKPSKNLTSGFVAVKATKAQVRGEMWQGYHDASNMVHEFLQDGLTAKDHPNPYDKTKK